jgi:hypothetical protein
MCRFFLKNAIMALSAIPPERLGFLNAKRLPFCVYTSRLPLCASVALAAPLCGAAEILRIRMQMLDSLVALRGTKLKARNWPWAFLMRFSFGDQWTLWNNVLFNSVRVFGTLIL